MKKRRGLAMLAASALMWLPAASATEVDQVAAEPRPYFSSLVADTVRTKIDAEIFIQSGPPSPAPPEVDRIIQRVWQRVRAQIPLSGEPVVYFDDCVQTRADSFPQGAIRVCKGLLAQLTSEDELAAVLAHEAAHLVFDHGRFSRYNSATGRTIEVLTIAGYAAGIVASGGATAVVLGGALVANQPLGVQASWFDRYAREQELQADRLSIDLVARAGFSANGVDRLFQVLRLRCDPANATAEQEPEARRRFGFNPANRNTHPDDGVRACAMKDYVDANYPDALDRPMTPLPWARGANEARPRNASGAYFADLDRAMEVARSLGASAPETAMPPADLCASSREEAARLTRTYPRDQDYRRFRGAVEVRCGSASAAFNALLPDTREPRFVRNDGWEAIALALLSGSRQEAAQLYRGVFNAEFNLTAQAERERNLAALDRQGNNVLGMMGVYTGARLGLNSNLSTTISEYQTFACVMDSPELKAEYDRICNDLFAGTAAGWTCDPTTYVGDFRTSRLAGRPISYCPTSSFGREARSIGPLDYLREQSPWYASVYDVAPFSRRLAQAEADERAAREARRRR